MVKHIFLSIAALLFIASPVMAEDVENTTKTEIKADTQQPMKHPHKQKEQGAADDMDANGNGLVSRSEFMSFHADRFAEADANNDGSIDKDEARAAHEAMKKKMEERRAKMKAQRQKKIKELKAQLQALESETESME